jgi:hypothetical protein
MLGARIAAAHQDAAALLPGLPTLQIGMDTPQAGPGVLAAAAAALTAPGVEAVLGPAADGGWWAPQLPAPGSRPPCWRSPTTSQPRDAARRLRRPTHRPNVGAVAQHYGENPLREWRHPRRFATRAEVYFAAAQPDRFSGHHRDSFAHRHSHAFRYRAMLV